MFELISYCILGACLLWTLGLVFFMIIESAQYVQELEKVCHSHAKWSDVDNTNNKQLSS